MLSAVGILSAFLLFLVPLIHGQTTGTVSIVDLADWNNAPVDVQKCLWQPGASDVASTLGCPSPTLNVCFCPTGAASSKALSAITGCMTYWFENNGILQLPTAVSVYSEYCADAVGGWSILFKNKTKVQLLTSICSFYHKQSHHDTQYNRVIHLAAHLIIVSNVVGNVIPIIERQHVIRRRNRWHRCW